MKTQLDSHKLGKCLLASALIGGVAFAGVPTISTVSAFADDTPTQDGTTDGGTTDGGTTDGGTTDGGTTDGSGDTQTEPTQPMSTILDTMMTTIGSSDESVRALIQAQLSDDGTETSEITWPDWCTRTVQCLNDPDTWQGIIDSSNQEDLAHAVQALYGEDVASWDVWEAAVSSGGGSGSEDSGTWTDDEEETLDGIDVELQHKVSTYNGGTTADYGTYASFTATFKISSDVPAKAVWTLPAEYTAKEATIVNSGMLAPEVVITSSGDDEDEDFGDDEGVAYEDGDAELAAVTLADDDDWSDEEEEEEVERDSTTLTAYVSSDGTSLSIDLPVSEDPDTTIEGTISFATHTDMTQDTDGTVLATYFSGTDAEGFPNFVKDFEVSEGSTDTSKYEKANEGYRVAYAGEPFTITLDSQGGTEVPAKEMTELTEDSASKLSITVPTKDNNDFGGWYLDPEGTKPLDPFQMKPADVTAYAKWIVRAEPKIIPQVNNDTNPGTPVTSSATQPKQEQKQQLVATGDQLPAGAIIAGIGALIAAGAAAARRR